MSGVGMIGRYSMVAQLYSGNRRTIQIERGRVSDQLSDRLIFGRLFQANEKFSTFRSYANL